MDFVQAIYKLTGTIPKEDYGLTSKLRLSAVSIPSNIAEGAARNTDKEFLNFIHIAQGSAAEAETQLLIAQRLDYYRNVEPVLSGLRTVQKLLHGIMRHYKAKRMKSDV